jgi:hypothetical protein
VIARLLAVSDSRFQPGLIKQAKDAGKLADDFQLEARFTDNTPQRLEAIRARHARLFPEYPMGSDFTAEERDLLRALNWLKSKFKLSEVLELGKAALDAPGPEGYERTWRGCSWIAAGVERSFISGCCWRGWRRPIIGLRPCGAGPRRRCESAIAFAGKGVPGMSLIR